MGEWPLETVLSVYKLIESGEKTYDTRAPDNSNPKKQLTKAKVGDFALVIPVDDSTFEQLDLPILKYEISDVQHFRLKEDEDSWEPCVKRMLGSVGLEKVFLEHSLEEALDMYNQWPSTPRIIKNGIVALGFGKRI